jgi:signal transduction histidine kinase
VARSRSRWLVVIPSVVLVLGILGAGAWQLSNALGSRLHRLERGTRKIADGDLAHRIDLSDRSVRDELDDLSVAFNDMAARLQQLVGAQQTLLANVSHELRTPLARMRVVLEIVEERLEGISTTPSEAHERLRTAVADMAEDLGETEVLIRDLLTSGRLALREGNKQESETLDLAAIGHKLAARFEARSEIEGDLKVAGEPLLLERLLSNLLANARRASPRGDVLVRMYRRASRVAIEVQDDGPGISPEQREAVFEAFVRLDAARSRDTGGTGLGLFLARQICRSHGGWIRVEGREDGRSGARFIVELPASSAGDESRQPAPDVAP